MLSRRNLQALERTAGGAGAAAAVGTKTGRSLLGKAFRTGTPLSGLGFAATNVASKMKEGQSFADAVRSLNWFRIIFSWFI